MRKFAALHIILLTLISTTLFAQTSKVVGTIKNSETRELMPYATVRVIEQNRGTTANAEGKFALQLEQGRHTVIASYLGFVSDTIIVTVSEKSNTQIEFKLSPSQVNVPQVTIFPKENPAFAIIRKAQERMEVRNRLITNYVYTGFSKIILKTPNEISASGSGVSLGLSQDTSSTLQISGILENQSVRYFKAPDQFRERIIARKQTENLPPAVNVLTGGRIIQNFYSDDLQFVGVPMEGPLSENSTDYYFFLLQDTVSIDNQNVYKISMEPLDDSDPGFVGDIYILDKTFDLIKVELQLNKAASFGGMFRDVKIFQNFFPYTEEKIYFPVDYNIHVDVNFMGLASAVFVVESVLSDYQINTEIPEDIFGKAVVKVMPDADTKDSLYWAGIPTIPYSEEELLAYVKIDSVESIEKTFWEKYDWFDSRIMINDNFIVSNLLGLYHFNSIEGHSADFKLEYKDDEENQRLSSDVFISHGFSDDKTKYGFSASYLFGDYRTTRLSFSAYDRLTPIFSGAGSFDGIIPSLTILFSKHDYRNYYYSKGINARLSGELFPVILGALEFKTISDRSAKVNTHEAILNNNKTYRVNPKIYDGSYKILKAELTLDPRNYFENGYRRIRVSEGETFAALKLGVESSLKNTFGGSTDFTTYSAEIFGRVVSGRYIMDLNAIANSSTGSKPYQLFTSLPGNIDILAGSNSFRTLGLYDAAGDRTVQVFLEHNFTTSLFKLLNVPLLEETDLNIGFFTNMAISQVTDGSKSILTTPVNEFRSPFYEAGFTLGTIAFPIELSFAWKLNYADKNDFVFGISSFLPF